jgi:SAM domain (Sterile alpha motif)
MGVRGWLRSLCLGRYEALFRASEIDADILPDLADADLEKLGVPLGHRKRLPQSYLRFDRRQGFLSSDGAAATPTPPTVVPRKTGWRRRFPRPSLVRDIAHLLADIIVPGLGGKGLELRTQMGDGLPLEPRRAGLVGELAVTGAAGGDASRRRATGDDIGPQIGGGRRAGGTRQIGIIGGELAHILVAEIGDERRRHRARAPVLKSTSSL